MSAASLLLHEPVRPADRPHPLLSSGRRPCGVSEIDRLLGGGFAPGEMTEILCPHPGSGELSLLLAEAVTAKHVCWVLDPVCGFSISPEALEAAGLDMTRQLFTVPGTPSEAFWTAETAAESGETDLIIAYLPVLSAAEDRAAMTRLSLAARRTGTGIFAIRPSEVLCSPSPAQWRVRLTPGTKDGRVSVNVIRRGTLFDRSSRTDVTFDSLLAAPYFAACAAAHSAFGGARL